VQIQEQAEIRSMVVVLDDRVGLVLWASPWNGPDDETWEAFLGQEGDERVAVFPSAAALHQFLRSGQGSGLAEHPMWAQTLRCTESQLRASSEDVIDLDDMYSVVAEPVSPEGVVRAAGVLAFVSGIADVCGDSELSAMLDAPEYRMLLDSPQDPLGRRGASAWLALGAQVVQQSPSLCALVDDHLAWLGDFGSAGARDVLAYEQEFPWRASGCGAGDGGPASRRDEAGYSALAIVAFVAAFVVGFGLPSIACGHLALSEIRRTGKRGRGLATAGLVLGYLELVAVGVLIVALAALSASVSS
jgi:hypothetical protein